MQTKVLLTFDQIEDRLCAHMTERKLLSALGKPAVRRQSKPTCSVDEEIDKALRRMRSGEIRRWFIHRVRRELIDLGLIDIVKDEETGLWIGDRISKAGIVHLHGASPTR